MNALPPLAAWMAAAALGVASPAHLKAQEMLNSAVSPALLAAAEDDSPLSRDALFGDESATPVPGAAAPGWKGFVQGELARTMAEPVHWSKMLLRAELGRQGRFGDNVKWKLSARADYDAVFDLYDRYPAAVRRDQRFNLSLRENYLDVGAGDWDFRFGRQQVVWGEMVGLFFADVVSAKDLREFILPEFEILRIPQWAARAEYFRNDLHAELLWIPVPSYDEIGKPGAEFYPLPPPAAPGFATVLLDDERPQRKLAHTNYGLRLSWLAGGWDMSAFYYRSMDSAATFYREIVGGAQPAFIYQPRHDRVEQFGGTLAKDFGAMVLKAEAVHTADRRYNVLRFDDADGVVPQDTLDWVLGLDFSLPAEGRLNLQVFQRVFFDRDPDILFDKRENGFSVFASGKIGERIELQALAISSINRNDWLLRPRLTWAFERNWRLALGADVFKGPPLGLFGRFDNRDRVYTELRYSF